MSNNDYAAEKLKTEDMVYYGSGAYMPRDLYIHTKRPLTLALTAMALIFSLFILSELTPTSILVGTAELFNQLFWRYFKQTSFEGCTAKCHMIAYGLVAIPISWGSSIIVALWTIPLAVRDWQARREALRHGAAPQGKTASGKIRPIPSFVFSVLLGAIMFIALFVTEFLLYLLAGADTNIRGGRVLPPLMIDFQTTFLMSATQFLAVVSMSALVLAAHNLKKFVKS